MKTKIIALTLAALLGATFQSHAFDPKDLLGRLTGSAQSDSTASGTSDSDGGGILGAIGSFVNNIAANKRFSVDDLVGTWVYDGPAVSFQSDNALKKIGGAGAAAAVENKLEPYYKKLGFTRTSLTVDKEHNFTLKMGVLSLAGKVEKDENDMLVFNFSAFGKISLGKVAANATKAGDKLNLTFDATRMVQLLTSVSKMLNNTTLNALTTLLNSYDGIYMGYKLKFQK